MSQRLPSVPNLDYLKKHAKDVLRVARHRNSRCRLTDAQHALARGYGFGSWPDLKVHIALQRQKPTEQIPVLRLPARRGASSFGAAKAGHPMTGIWVTIRTRDPRHDSADLTLEFAFADDVVTLVQIACDKTGVQTALRMTILADGCEHPFPFGDRLVMRAQWSDRHTLALTVSQGDATVSSGTYALSDDGKSLVVSTMGSVVVLERVS